MKNPPASAATPVIRKTIFRAIVDSSLVFALVEYTDGRLGILRNDAPLPHGPWENWDLCDCIQTFQQLSRQAIPLAATGHQDGSPSPVHPHMNMRPGTMPR